MRVILSVFLAVSFSETGFAEDRPELRELIECSSGKGFAKLAKGLAGLDAKRLDTINTKPSFTLAVNDGGELPERIFVRNLSGETDLNMSSDGEVREFISLFAEDDDAELCVEDPSRVGIVKDKNAFGLSMAFNMNFLNTSGVYSLDEIKDGMKDGKSALKKMVPGPVALILPKMSHLYFEFEDDAVAPEFRMFRADSEGELQDIGVADFVRLGPNFMVAVEDLKDANMDELRVSGGVHTMSPSLSPKRMAKLIGKDQAKTANSDKESD